MNEDRNDQGSKWMYAVGLYYDHGHGTSRRLKSRKLQVKFSHEVAT